MTAGDGRHENSSLEFEFWNSCDLSHNHDAADAWPVVGTIIVRTPVTTIIRIGHNYRRRAARHNHRPWRRGGNRHAGCLHGGDHARRNAVLLKVDNIVR